MIGRLKGIILEKQPPQMLLETYGVGYEVQLPMSYFCILPEIGQEAVIFTYFIVRENTQLLFGFIQKQEQMLFRELIKINGIGPKLALEILSGMSALQFIKTITRKEVNALAKLPGVGKKIAERLVIEMRGKFKKLYVDQTHPDINVQIDFSDTESAAVSALVTLGYKRQEACQMISKAKSVENTIVDSETLIRSALRTTL